MKSLRLLDEYFYYRWKKRKKENKNVNEFYVHNSGLESAGFEDKSFTHLLAELVIDRVVPRFLDSTSFLSDRNFSKRYVTRSET